MSVWFGTVDLYNLIFKVHLDLRSVAVRPESSKMFHFWLIPTFFLLHSVTGTYLVLNPYLAGGAGGNEFTWGTPMGTMCYQNTVKSYYPVTTTTFYINTAVSFKFTIIFQ